MQRTLLTALTIAAVSSNSLLAQEAATVPPRPETPVNSIPVPSENPTPPSASNYPKTSVGLGLIAASTGKWDDLIATDGTTSVSGEAEIDFKQAFALKIDCKLNFLPNTWGFGFGAWYEAEHDADGGSITLAGTKTLIGNEDPATFSQVVGFANAVYRWDSIFFNGGLNYNVVQYKAPSSFDGKIDVSGGLGLQLGLGGNVNDKVALDVMYQQTYLGIKETIGSIRADFGDGYVSSISFGARYYVN